MTVSIAIAPLVPCRRLSSQPAGLREEILRKWEGVACSPTEAVFHLRYHDFLGNEQVPRDLKQYFQREWFSCHRMWARCFRSRVYHLNCETTNPLEGFHNGLKARLEGAGMMSRTPRQVFGICVVRAALLAGD